MDRVYESGASAIAPTPPAVPSTGFPSRGNPGTGTMPTVPGPYMMHQLVEEIMAVISAAAITPDKAVLNQLKLALDSIYMSKNGTSALLQNFAGLTRSMTALGGGLVREYVDVTNAATVGGIEIGVVYNCAVNPVTGVWAGRDIADICWLEKWHDVAGTKEFWFAPTGAAGVVPAWVNVFTLNTNTGALSVSGNITAAAATLATHLITLGQGDTRYAGLPAGNYAGSVAHFAMSTAPAGWLKANGALISRTTYAALFSAIGTTFGVGDGLTTFALPDLRGEFIRGFDDARGVDTARVLGSAQVATSIGTYAHSDGSVAGAVAAISIGIVNPDASGPALASINSPYYMAAASTANGGAGYTGTATVRPRNIALLACIKY